MHNTGIVLLHISAEKDGSSKAVAFTWLLDIRFLECQGSMRRNDACFAHGKSRPSPYE